MTNTTITNQKLPGARPAPDYPSSANNINKITLALLAVLALLLIIPSQVVWAHARFKSSNIQPDAVVATVPTSLSVTFTEETSPAQTRLQVLDASGRAVDKGDQKVSGDTVTVSLGVLADGKYTVKFRTFTEEDSNVVEGQYNFTVTKSAAAAAGDASKATQVESQSQGGSTPPSGAPATGQGSGATAAADGDWMGIVLGLLALAVFSQLGIFTRGKYLRERRRHR